MSATEIINGLKNFADCGDNVETVCENLRNGNFEFYIDTLVGLASHIRGYEEYLSQFYGASGGLDADIANDLGAFEGASGKSEFLKDKKINIFWKD